MNPRRVERLPWREIEGRTVIIHPQKGEVHEVNAVGTLLWSQADGTRSVAELADQVTESFQVSSEEALQDTQSFFSEMEKHQLIQWNT